MHEESLVKESAVSTFCSLCQQLTDSFWKTSIPEDVRLFAAANGCNKLQSWLLQFKVLGLVDRRPSLCHDLFSFHLSQSQRHSRRVVDILFNCR